MIYILLFFGHLHDCSMLMRADHRSLVTAIYFLCIPCCHTALLLPSVLCQWFLPRYCRGVLMLELHPARVLQMFNEVFCVVISQQLVIPHSLHAYPHTRLSLSSSYSSQVSRQWDTASRAALKSHISIWAAANET
jgi:hypothetical protein